MQIVIKSVMVVSIMALFSSISSASSAMIFPNVANDTGSACCLAATSFGLGSFGDAILKGMMAAAMLALFAWIKGLMSSDSSNEDKDADKDDKNNGNQ